MGFDTVSRMFHWVTVILVAIMIPTGIVMTQDIPRPLQNQLFILHKGLGPLVLLVVVLRIGWRLAHPAPALPASVPPAQARIAGAVHVALYGFLLLQAVSGYVRVTTGGYPIEALEALGIPPLLSKAEAVGKAASAIHWLSGLCLTGLILLHIAAAAFHGLVKRDGVASMMWPPVAPHGRRTG